MEFTNRTSNFFLPEVKVNYAEELKAPKISKRLPKIKAHNLPELNLRFAEDTRGLIA